MCCNVTSNPVILNNYLNKSNILFGRIKKSVYLQSKIKKQNLINLR